MRVVDSLLNQSEKTVFHELEDVASDNGMKVFAKVRLSDVIQKENTHLSDREFEFYTRSHCDFVLTDAQARPIIIVEYDGPLHQLNAKQQDRDKIKNELCRRAEVGLLRINDRYVTKLYRGMSVLRWIVEVMDLEKAFYEAQRKGDVPWDEPFDPAAIMSVGSRSDSPYWLSAPAIQSFHNFFNTFPRDIPKGWCGIAGNDDNGTTVRLELLYFGNNILYSKTRMRKQYIEFPDYDLLDQINTCELGIILKKFRKREIATLSPVMFRPVFERFCERYNAHLSHSMGAFPFDIEWGSVGGWKTRQQA